MEHTDFVLTPAIGKNFVGRRALIDELVKELADRRSHIGFCLYGRRRVGKTSMLMETKHLLAKNDNVIVAYLSLYDVADLSSATFSEELINAVITAYQEKGLVPLKMRIRDLISTPLSVVGELLKNLKIETTIAEHIKLMLEYKDARDKGKNYSDYVRQAFNTGQVLANATRTKCIIILDEFPEITKFENGLQLVKMLRTQYELQDKTAIVISGSIKKTIEVVALSEGSPFYKQLIPKHILPFTEKETEEFLKLYLGKVDKNEVHRLYGVTGGLPFYLQFIGRSTKYSGSIESIINTFVDQEGDLFFHAEFEKLSEKEKLIVTSLAKGASNLTEIAKDINEPTTTVGRYLPTLLNEDIVEKESRGTYLLSDKLFSYWLKKRAAR